MIVGKTVPVENQLRFDDIASAEFGGEIEAISTDTQAPAHDVLKSS